MFLIKPPFFPRRLRGAHIHYVQIDQKEGSYQKGGHAESESVAKVKEIGARDCSIESV
jgi:hypothetical protein